MTLGAPLGLLALLGILPLLAAYFLRRRQKPVKVSALFLWRTPDTRAEAGPRFERFSRELSLLLEILAVIAAAAFLSDVGCGARRLERHAVLVVDGSLSMSARDEHGTPVAEKVRREVARAVESAGADRVTLVESGVQPRVLAGPADRASRALSALEAWQPRGAHHDPAAALVLAKELAGPNQRVLFFTDALPEDAAAFPPEVEVRALGVSRENLAIVSAQRSDEGEVARVTVRVANFGKQERLVPVDVTAKSTGTVATVEQHPKVKVPAGGSALLDVGLKNVGEVQVRLPEDALPEDGEVTLLPSPARTVDVALLAGLDPSAKAALERFLSVAPGISTTSADGALSFGARGSQAQVTFGAPGTQKTYVGPFFAERAHPLLEDVQLSGVVWTAGQNPPGHPLLSAGSAVLLSEDGGTVHFNIDLSRSDLQRTPAWPVLLGNLLRRARETLPGLPRRHVVLGEELPVVVTAGAKNELRGPSGGERPILGVGALVLPPPPSPGRYQLLRDGVVVDEVQVLAIDPRESDLRARGGGERKATSGEWAVAKAAGFERAPWPLLVLLALLLADFALTARGVRT